MAPSTAALFANGPTRPSLVIAAVLTAIVALGQRLFLGLDLESQLLYSANTLLTIEMITRECLRVLENNTVFAKYVDRQYDDQFARSGAKIGDTCNIRKPVRYLVSDGPTLSIQNSEEESVPIRLQSQKHVGLAFTSTERLLHIDDFSKRHIVPAIAALANKVDLDGLGLYKKVYNAVGTAATVPATSLTYLDAGVKLDNNAAPQDEMRYMVVNSRMQAKLISAEQTLFHSGEEISRQYRKGRIGTAHGFNWYMDQNVRTHTYGAQGGTPLVVGADQSGNSLAIDGCSNSITGWGKEGDDFTIDGVYAVNPQSYESTGELQQFTLTADVNSNGSGQATLVFEPAIIVSGAKQTVTALPANDAAINWGGATAAVSPQGLAFHRDAFALVMADLPAPEGGAEFQRLSSKKLGIALRLVKQYDIVNDRNICRVDVLYGWAPLRPEMACRVKS